MKKLCCMVALAAISFGTVCEAVPVNKTMMTDTVKVKKKKVKVKTDSGKMKMKMKDTTKM